MKKTFQRGVMILSLAMVVSGAMASNDNDSTIVLDNKAEDSAGSSAKVITSSKDYAFYIDYDKKILYVDNLGLPPSDNVSSLLRLLPELLQRPGQKLATSYDVKINGMSLGENCDAALENLQIGDIEKLEVSESPLSSYNNVGQNGAIDIILRSKSLYKDDEKKKWWGSASLSVRYQTNIMPYVNLNYKTDKFIIQGLNLSELHNFETKSSSVTGIKQSSGTDTERERRNFTGIYAKYNPTAKDELAFKSILNYNYVRSLNTTEPHYVADDPLLEVEDTVHSIDFRFLTHYKHQFSSRMKAEAEVQYNNKHNGDNGNDERVLSYITTNANTISGTVNLTYRLINNSERHIYNYGDIKIGSDYNFSSETKFYDIFAISYQEKDYSSDGHSAFFMPYLKWESRFGKFRMQVQGEWQNFNFKISEGDKEQCSYKHNDFTGSLVLEHGIGKKGFIRLLGQRKIQRPTLRQVYPHSLVLPYEQLIIRGNSNLAPLLSHEVSLDYISRYMFGDHNLTIDISGSYQYVSDIINTLTTPVPNSISPSSTPYNMESYVNNGHANILNFNLMTFYKYKSFTLSFTGNLYHMNQDALDVTKTSTYFNLALKPAFDLPSGWSSSLYVAYHSRVETESTSQGDCAYSQLTIGKRIKRCNIFVYQRSAFISNVLDRTYNTDGEETKYTHPLVSNAIGLGVQYLF